MYLRRIKFIWLINLVMFVAVVFFGIEQAGLGAEISNLENKYEKLLVEKNDLSEVLFINQSDSKILSSNLKSEFVKSSNVIYFDSIDTVASK